MCISSSCRSLSVSGKNGVRGESGVSDDDLASDVLSHYSSASESASVIEESTGTCTVTVTIMYYVLYHNYVLPLAYSYKKRTSTH